MHEVVDVTMGSAFMIGLLLIFGLCALVLGLFMAAFGSGKSRAMGFLEMIFGWCSWFAIYLFFWNPDFLWNMVGVVIGAIIGIAIALGLLFLLVMKS